MDKIKSSIPSTSTIAGTRQPCPDSLQELSAFELLRLCLDSQEEAPWCEFVYRFQPLIAAIVIKSIRRWTKPAPPLVDDLVQETYVRLCIDNFRPLREFDCRHESALFGFLKVIAYNVVQDHFRSYFCQKRGSGKADTGIDQVKLTVGSGNCQQKIEQQILLREIKELLQKQTSDHNFTRDWTVFHLYYEQGFTARAISCLPNLDLNVKGVESVLLRLTRLARTQLTRSALIASNSKQASALTA